ncbi:MAG: Smr/MutS family protein [Fibrobacter sp.]|nr:Smr/MutS family protein [Fibrobacter sp.]
MKPKNKNGSYDLILSYLDKHGVMDKDALGGQRKANRNTSRKLSRLVVDLHGMKSDEAAGKVRKVISECREKGKKELLIIHGKGYHSDPVEGPVLKKMVRDMLEKELGNSVRDYRSALPKDGGDGATVVYLK